MRDKSKVSTPAHLSKNFTHKVVGYATDLPTHSGVHYLRMKFDGVLSILTASCTTEVTIDDASLSHDKFTVPAPVPHQTVQQLFQYQ